MKKVSIVVPMFNEEEMAPLFFEAINKVITSCSQYEFEIVAVNDGSKDHTLDILKAEQEKNSHLVIVDLSRNWGHESAVYAGIKNASGDAVIPIDADLQDPPEIIPQMLEMWEQGYLVVNAKRTDRKEDSSFKRNTAGLYYKLLHAMSPKIKIPENVANFRLLDRRVANEIIDLKETSRVFRVQVPFIGFKTGEVVFVRAKRKKGKSKYNLDSMFNLALSSVVSLTTMPLKWSISLTVFFFIVTLLSGITHLIFYICYLNGSTAISPLGISTWFIVNIVLLVATLLFASIAILSAYISEAVKDARRRPNVIINEVIRKEKK